MSKVRTLFLGTPLFAATALESLLKDEHFDIVGVVTQPDRPKGRNLQLSASLVKELAQKNNLKVFTPDKINSPDSLEQLRALKAEIAVVVAFGQILSQEFLDMFNFGAVNVHGSLLPLWRGAAPIQRSLEAGDEVTGVTLQKIVRELDAGDIIGSRKVTLNKDINALELHDILADLSCELLAIDLMDYIRGNLAPRPQDASKATFAPKINKLETQVDWTQGCLKVHNKVRGFLMGPGCWSSIQGKRLKLFKTTPLPLAQLGRAPGHVGLLKNSDQVCVQTGQGCLELLEVQVEGKKRVPALEWWKSLTVKDPQFEWLPTEKTI